MRNKALLAAGLLLGQAALGPFALAKFGQAQASGVVTGFVVPTEVGEKEPFTFAATNVVEGDVVSIETLEGEVVATKKTDRFGRIFLPAGLAAGAYLLSAKSGKSTRKLEVQPPRELPNSGGLTIPELPGSFNTAEGLGLQGSGMNPDAAQMSLTFGGQSYPVLAGTATEMKTGPLPPEACGTGPVEVTNLANGDTSRLDSVVAYSLTAKLNQQKLVGGQKTTLDFTLRPENIGALVDARILGGPVSFAGGGKEAQVEVQNGHGSLPLTADPGGKGSFQVAYNIHEILGAGAVGNPAGNEKPEPQGNERAKRCPKTKHIRDEANGWSTSEKRVADPDNPGKTKIVYVASRTVRCSIHKSCSKREGHSGDCVFTGKSRCKDHDTTETREFDSEEARRDGMKDTKVPDDIKYP